MSIAPERNNLCKPKCNCLIQPVNPKSLKNIFLSHIPTMITTARQTKGFFESQGRINSAKPMTDSVNILISKDKYGVLYYVTMNEAEQ